MFERALKRLLGFLFSQGFSLRFSSLLLQTPSALLVTKAPPTHHTYLTLKHKHSTCTHHNA